MGRCWQRAMQLNTCAFIPQIEKLHCIKKAHSLAAKIHIAFLWGAFVVD
jgi:hypothetical protein